MYADDVVCAYERELQLRRALVHELGVDAFLRGGDTLDADAVGGGDELRLGELGELGDGVDRRLLAPMRDTDARVLLSAWVLERVRHGFFVVLFSEVPSTTSENAAFLDPHSREFDKAMFDFAEGKLKKDERLGVIRRMGPSASPIM